MPSSQGVTAGRSLCTEACASCRGDNAQGGYGQGGYRPSLHGLGLPGFGGAYNAARQQALATYVQSLRR